MEARISWVLKFSFLEKILQINSIDQTFIDKFLFILLCCERKNKITPIELVNKYAQLDNIFDTWIFFQNF